MLNCSMATRLPALPMPLSVLLVSLFGLLALALLVLAHAACTSPIPKSGMGKAQAAWASTGRASASSAKHDARSVGGSIGSAGSLGAMPQLST